MNIESRIKENQKEIIIKRQQIEDENIKIKKLEKICVDKDKTILDAQIEIKNKQSQLEVFTYFNVYLMIVFILY